MIVVACTVCMPIGAWADTQIADGAQEVMGEDPTEEAALQAEGGSPVETTVEGATVSYDEAAVVLDGCSFGLQNFNRANAGSNKTIDGDYYGYSYLIGTKPTDIMYIATTDTMVVYVSPKAADRLGIKIGDETDEADLTALLQAIDEVTTHGNRGLAADTTWYFTEEEAIEIDGVIYSFGRNLPDGRSYDCVIGRDGSDVTETGSDNAVTLTHAGFAELVGAGDAAIVGEPTTGEKIGGFFATLDWSPLIVTLKTSLTAIVLIFILGLAAAYLTLRASARVRDLLDTLFTIPMVLPPTVCGFLLLLLLGNNTALGQWFNSVGFPLVFSWPATVIAAVVVAFPLMYRNARGAFENLDPNMMDAARTLGWKESRIFFKIMLPLAWSSIAAGTVLSFARALGEYGATLFLAGNYAGITRTIPISIYFYWKIGRTDLAIFWTLVIIVFSFIVILFINLWDRRTTRYRRKDVETR
jgi:molybdate transport system permease protein